MFYIHEKTVQWIFNKYFSGILDNLESNSGHIRGYVSAILEQHVCWA